MRKKYYMNILVFSSYKAFSKRQLLLVLFTDNTNNK